jgi:hypothetical protein
MANSLYFWRNDKKYTKTYQQLLHPEPVDNRTGEEIAREVILKAGLKPKGE